MLCSFGAMLLIDLFALHFSTIAVIAPAFVIILVIMTLLKNAWKNKYVQAILRGLKPCTIGIILATGCYMVLNNCFGISDGGVLHLRTIMLTAVLAAVYFGLRKVNQKGISPIGLILLSACLGAVVYAI